MSRPIVFAANWKMHHGPVAARAFLADFLPRIVPAPGRTLWFFVPGPSLPVSADLAKDRTDVHVGAQNIHGEPKGAFTGEVSAAIVKEAGAQGVLVGHSERRHVFGERDEESGRKFRAALDAGLRPMLCVGETLAQREAGETEAVCLRQLRAGLALASPAELARVQVAYEPVWAIGTGRNATPADAGAVHRVLRNDVRGLGATEPVILYGGSVNPGNVRALVGEPEVDGVLVGGASLDPAKWAELVTAGSAG
jgi:triosephosphate isomerase